MVAASIACSFSTLTFPAKSRRDNRFSGVTMASASENLDNVKVAEGLGTLQKVILTSAQGSGGIPHCFPQFGPAPLQQHGFARNMNWSIVKSESVEGNPTITLELKDGLCNRSMWDYSFQALYKVTLDKTSLSTEYNVKNTDEKPFSFSNALHTYFSLVQIQERPLNGVASLRNNEISIMPASVVGASVRGLKGCKTLDKNPDPKKPSGGDAVTFPGFVDCIYLDAPEQLHLDNGLGDLITMKNTNWSDTVLWSPHLTMESCNKDFVCVENANIGQVQLQPNETWTTVQHLSLA